MAPRETMLILALAYYVLFVLSVLSAAWTCRYWRPFPLPPQLLGQATVLVLLLGLAAITLGIGLGLML